MGQDIQMGSINGLAHIFPSGYIANYYFIRRAIYHFRRT